MKQTILKYGLISGGILAATMSVTMVFYLRGQFDFDHGALTGYSAMVLAFIMVFAGIRSYREHSGGGSITFGRGVLVGLGITLIASACYVATWEVCYYKFTPGFAEECAVHEVAKVRASGASAEKVAAKQQEMQNFIRLYHNPLINIGMTFLEVFPVGLIVTLTSAAILRKKSQAGSLATAPVTA